MSSANAKQRLNFPHTVWAYFERLHEAAISITGLSDFGNDSYQEALLVLLDEYEKDPHILAHARHRYDESIIGGLVGRLISEQQWKTHPEVLKLPVKAPIIIAGLPRTGTSILYKFLSIDPQLQKLEFWLGNSPMPRPPRDEWDRCPEYQQTVKFIDEFYAKVPEYRAIHDMSADMPEEDRTLLMQEFSHLWFMESAHVPRYDHFVEDHDATVDYQRFADNLRLIGSNDPDKRWVLKDPVHPMFMDTLLDTFPDACVIQTHRDPVKSLSSLCSLVTTFRKYMEYPGTDPLLIGQRKIEHWSAALTKTMAVRERKPNNFIDIHLQDIIKNPMGVIEKVYQACNLPLGQEMRHNYEDWIEQNRKDKHGVHSYEPETYGLSREKINAAFGEYMKTYGVIEEK